jgi:trans-aconitate methyltransferase
LEESWIITLAKKSKADKKNINQPYYEGLWSENMLHYLENSAGSRWFDDLLQKIVKDTKKNSIKNVADIGCGLGLHTVLLAKYYTKAKVTGFDFSSTGIAAAKKNHKLKNLSFSVEDITKAKNNKKYDIITAFDVLEHIEDWQGLVRNLIKVNNRYFIFASPVGRMRTYEKYIGHFRNFKKGEIEDFMKSQGYKTVKTYYAGFPFYSPIVRDLTNRFYKSYELAPQSEMSGFTKFTHHVWYFLFKYCSLKHKGDNFIGLFEKDV